MERKYIYGVVALVVIIFILFLIMRKKGTDSSSSPSDTTVGPTIEVGDLQATQTPDKSDNTVENTKTESYMIQTSEGYANKGNFDDKELSKNIKLKLTWNNGGGWDEISKIIIKWEQEVTDETDETKTKNVERMRHTIQKGASENAKYFTQYESGLTHTFQANKKEPVGTAAALDVDATKKFSAVGKNMIHVYYIDKNNEEVRLTGDDVPSYTVTVDMLSATKDLLSAKTFTYKPTTGTEEISASITEHEYYLYNNAINKDMIKHIDNNKKGKVLLLPEGVSAANSTVRLKVNLDVAASTGVTAGNKYFLKRGTGGIIEIFDATSVTTFGDEYKFEVVTGSEDKYIRFRQLGDTHKDKFMMVDFGENGNKKLKIKTYTDIDDACTNKSLDFILSEDEKTDLTDCSS